MATNKISNYYAVKMAYHELDSLIRMVQDQQQLSCKLEFLYTESSVHSVVNLHNIVAALASIFRPHISCLKPGYTPTSLA